MLNKKQIECNRTFDVFIKNHENWLNTEFKLPLKSKDVNNSCNVDRPKINFRNVPREQKKSVKFNEIVHFFRAY